MTPHPILLATAVAGVLTLGTPVFTVEYFVAHDGEDPLGGLSRAQAKGTIQAAVDLTADGDTTLVNNGTYKPRDRTTRPEGQATPPTDPDEQTAKKTTHPREDQGEDRAALKETTSRYVWVESELSRIRQPIEQPPDADHSPNEEKTALKGRDDNLSDIPFVIFVHRLDTPQHRPPNFERKADIHVQGKHP